MPPSPAPLGFIAVPTAAQCLALAAPFLTLALLGWILARIDRTMHRLFPTLEWQRQLGWLNLRAERRAATVLRWLGYAVYATLGAALYGIAWGAVGLRSLDQWSDPSVTIHLVTRLPVLFTCLALWLFYLGAALWPSLRREYEREELERFRASVAATEREDESAPRSRLFSRSGTPVPPRPRSPR